MNIEINRYNFTSKSTLGIISIDGKYMGHTLEDPEREVKIKHKTCIPEGTYPIRYREVDSPMTLKYKKKYYWFKYHLELQNVPYFKYIYLHIGNTPGDTSGCVLVGEYSKKDKLYNSRIFFRKLYTTISEALDAGEKVTITIKKISTK